MYRTLVGSLALLVVCPVVAEAAEPPNTVPMKRVDLAPLTCGPQAGEWLEAGLPVYCVGYSGDIDGDNDDDLLLVHHWCGASVCYTRLKMQVNDRNDAVVQAFDGKDHDIEGALAEGGRFELSSHLTRKRHNGVSDVCLYSGVWSRCWRRDVRTQIWRQQGTYIDRSSSNCDASSFLGTWLITTRVFKGKKAHAAGVNGYYAMEVTGSGCQLTVSAAKVGYSTANGIREFSPEKRQSGTGVMTLSPDHGPGEIRLDLRRPDGSHVQATQFWLMPAGQELHGAWHYEAAAWRKAEMRGSLRAQRQAQGGFLPHPSAADVACQIQCMLHCDVVRPASTEHSPNLRGLKSCVQGCQARPGSRVRHCGR